MCSTKSANRCAVWVAVLAMVTLCLHSGSVAAARLMDANGSCLGAQVVKSPNSRTSVAVKCSIQARDFLAAGAAGEIRSGRWCLGIAGAHAEPGAWPGGSINWSGCIGTINLLWRFDGSQIKSRMHGYCLTRASVVDQGALTYQVQACDGGKRQQWRLLP